MYVYSRKKLGGMLQQYLFCNSTCRELKLMFSRESETLDCLETLATSLARRCCTSCFASFETTSVPDHRTHLKIYGKRLRFNDVMRCDAFQPENVERFILGISRNVTWTFFQGAEIYQILHVYALFDVRLKSIKWVIQFLDARYSQLSSTRALNQRRYLSRK